MNLCRLIRTAQMPNAKGMARLSVDELTRSRGDEMVPLSRHLIALVSDPKDRLPFYQEVFGPERVFIELHDHLAPDDQSKNQARIDLAEQHDEPLVITDEGLYATPDPHHVP